MAIPTLDELEAAYTAGASAAPDAKNPYFFGTALWTEWNYGQYVNRKVMQYKTPNSRIVRRAAVAVVVAAAAVGARYVLL